MVFGGLNPFSGGTWTLRVYYYGNCFYTTVLRTSGDFFKALFEAFWGICFFIFSRVLKQIQDYGFVQLTIFIQIQFIIVFIIIN